MSKAPAFGNYLQGYFYFRKSAAATDSKIKKYLLNTRANNQKLNSFYEKLPWLRDNLLEDFDSFWSTTWQPHVGRRQKSNYLEYWKSVRPMAKKIFSELLPNVVVDVPVVHFRCGDVPFIKHGMYHFTKKVSVDWMADMLLSRGYQKIILLSCPTFGNEQIFSCKPYIDFYISVFAEKGIETSVQCGSELEDFALMFYSPLLVSLNSSSFSFMAGIAKDPADYISCNMGKESKGEYSIRDASQADWIFDKEVPLLHSQIYDYSDTSSVIELLRLAA